MKKKIIAFSVITASLLLCSCGASNDNVNTKNSTKTTTSAESLTDSATLAPESESTTELEAITETPSETSAPDYSSMEHYNGTDVVSCQSMFGWGKPAIELDSYDSEGSYYAGYQQFPEMPDYDYEVDGIDAYTKYDAYLISAGYSLQSSEADNDGATHYTYVGNTNTIYLRIQPKIFEITIKKN